MVEVVTREEFDDFKKSMEGRLDKMDKSRRKINDDLLTAFGELTASVDKTDTAMRKRVDDVEDKSKSLFTRIKEAIEPIPEED